MNACGGAECWSWLRFYGQTIGDAEGSNRRNDYAGPRKNRFHQ
jgi:hypothetical protein